jgi:hypothetical protein
MNLIRPILTAFLAGIVLIASVGVTLNLHLCAGEVQSMALFVKPEPCKSVQKPCHGTERHNKKNGCCEEKSVVLKGKDATAEVKVSTQITPSFQLISVILPVLYSIVDLESSLSTPRYVHYKPPIIEKDITVLAHNFLI